MSWEISGLESIPLPGEDDPSSSTSVGMLSTTFSSCTTAASAASTSSEGETGGEENKDDAWRKAQEALKRIQAAQQQKGGGTPMQQQHPGSSAEGGGSDSSYLNTPIAMQSPIYQHQQQQHAMQMQNSWMYGYGYPPYMMTSAPPQSASTAAQSYSNQSAWMQRQQQQPRHRFSFNSLPQNAPSFSETAANSPQNYAHHHHSLAAAAGTSSSTSATTNTSLYGGGGLLNHYQTGAGRQPLLSDSSSSTATPGAAASSTTSSSSSSSSTRQSRFDQMTPINRVGGSNIAASGTPSYLGGGIGGYHSYGQRQQQQRFIYNNSSTANAQNVTSPSSTTATTLYNYSSQQQQQLQSRGDDDSETMTSSNNSVGTLPAQPLQQSNVKITDPSQWPQELKDYIERAYLQCENDYQKDRTERCLKAKLTPLFKTGRVFDIDWIKEPLPSEPGFTVNAPSLPAQQQQRPSGAPGFQLRWSGRGRGGSGAISGSGGAGGGGVSGRNIFDDRLPPNGGGPVAAGRGKFKRARRNKSRGGGGGGGWRGALGKREMSPTPAGRSSSDSRSPSPPSSISLRRKIRRKRSESIGSDGYKSDDSPDESSLSFRISTAADIGASGGLRSAVVRHHKPAFIPLKNSASKTHGSGNKKKKKGGFGKNRGGQKFLATGANCEELGPRDPRFVVDNETPEQQERLRQRAQRFVSSSAPPKSVASRINRGGNSDRYYQMPTSPLRDSDESSNLDESSLMELALRFKIVGTCEDIEKPYLRLTTAPDASQVRPEVVLVKSLEMVKRRWKSTKEYHFTCEQLKSIRQDLTIQCIRNEFAVDVYETHARIALEKGDREEFNQCQTQLRGLYHELSRSKCPNQNEFTAYRLLYYMYTHNTLDIVTFLHELTPESRSDPSIQFALNLRSAWSMHNYHRFFRLYKQAPLMSGYLLDLFIDRERKQALRSMLKAYRPHVEVGHIARELMFSSEHECLEFLQPLNLTFVDDQQQQLIDCRQSQSIKF